MLNSECELCGLIDRSGRTSCARCDTELPGIPRRSVNSRPGLISRLWILLLVCAISIMAFYLSLIGSAKRLDVDEEEHVARAIDILREKGFGDEVRLLTTVTEFRGSDNWLNAAVAKENAYAATNFPFEIMTLYPDFFTYPADDTERAAILLHEAQHLKGADEKAAYEFVWRHRKQLGWTRSVYYDSPVWTNVRRQTRETVPGLFICDFNEFNDCTD